MPGPEIVGVVAPFGVACGLTEVLEVASGPFGVVLVVAGDRPGAPLEPPSRRPVAFLEVRRRASGVSLIAQGQDRPVDTLDQLGGSLVALGAATGDVAGRDDLRGGGRFRIAAPGDEKNCYGGQDDSCRGPPAGSDDSDHCWLPMGIRYPRDLCMAMIPITCPSREAPTNYWPNPRSERCSNPFSTVSEDAFSQKFVKRFPNYSVGSCLIRSKEGKLSTLEDAPKAVRLLLSRLGRRHA